MKTLYTRATHTSVPSNVFAFVKKLKYVLNNATNTLSFRMNRWHRAERKITLFIGVTALWYFTQYFAHTKTDKRSCTENESLRI